MFFIKLLSLFIPIAFSLNQLLPDDGVLMRFKVERGFRFIHGVSSRNTFCKLRVDLCHMSCSIMRMLLALRGSAPVLVFRSEYCRYSIPSAAAINLTSPQTHLSVLVTSASAFEIPSRFCSYKVFISLSVKA